MVSFLGRSEGDSAQDPRWSRQGHALFYTFGPAQGKAVVTTWYSAGWCGCGVLLLNKGSGLGVWLPLQGNQNTGHVGAAGLEAQRVQLLQ